MIHHRGRRGHRGKKEDSYGDSTSVASEFSVVKHPIYAEGIPYYSCNVGVKLRLNRYSTMKNLKKHEGLPPWFRRWIFSWMACAATKGKSHSQKPAQQGKTATHPLARRNAHVNAHHVTTDQLVALLARCCSCPIRIFMYGNRINCFSRRHRGTKYWRDSGFFLRVSAPL